MTSMRVTFIALGLGLLVAAATASSAQAWVKQFGGTRDQVRTACANVGGQLSEGTDSKGVGYSMCMNNNNNTGVVCGDDGKCQGSGPRYAMTDEFEFRNPVLATTPGSLAGGGGSANGNPGGLSAAHIADWADGSGVIN